MAKALKPKTSQENPTDIKPKPSIYWDALPKLIQFEVENLSPKDQRVFDEMYGVEHRRLVVAAIMLACGGLHHAYFGRIGIQILFWLSWVTFVIGPIWLIFDIVSLPTYVEKRNQESAIKVLSSIRAVRR